MTSKPKGLFLLLLCILLLLLLLGDKSFEPRSNSFFFFPILSKLEMQVIYLFIFNINLKDFHRLTFGALAQPCMYLSGPRG